MYNLTKEELKSIFQLSDFEIKRARLDYLKNRKKDIEITLNNWRKHLENTGAASRWFCYEEIARTQKELDKINRLIAITKNPNKKESIDIQELKISIPIKSVIQVDWQYENSEKARAICPLHNEKTASFYIYKKTNSFYCFGCKQGGSVIDLVMKVHNYNISEAIKYLSSFLPGV